MAIPSGGSAVATPQNPTGTLTDYTALIDLSQFPQAWWDDCDINDGTYTRWSNDAKTVEYAADVYSFDTTAQTGFAAVKITGAWTATGDFPVRGFPAKTANGSYAATDTYGQYNAYGSTQEAYLPLSYDFLDRTQYNNDGIGLNGIVAGGHDGLFGNSTYFDGADDEVDIVSTMLDMTGDFSLTAVVSPNTLTGLLTAIGKRDYGGRMLALELNRPNLSMQYSYTHTTFSPTISMTPGSFYSLCLTRSGSLVTAYVNNTASTITGVTDTPTTDTFQIGRQGIYDEWSGYMQCVNFYSDVKTSAYAYHYNSNITTPSTFWGTWVWESGTVVTPLALSGSIDGTGQAEGALLNSLIISGSINGISNISADLSLLLELIGSINGTGEIIAESLLKLIMSGEINGQGQIIADALLSLIMSGEINGAGNIEGVLSGFEVITLALSGSINGSGEIVGDLLNKLFMSGSVDGEGEIVGRLTGFEIGYSQRLYEACVVTTRLHENAEIITRDLVECII